MDFLSQWDFSAFFVPFVVNSLFVHLTFRFVRFGGGRSALAFGHGLFEQVFDLAVDAAKFILRPGLQF